MTEHHLAQLNIGRLRAPLDDPRMADFVRELAPVNALAESSPGFVWRLREEETDDATGLRPFGPDILVNMSVWESYDALWAFTYRTDGHLEVLRRRASWFVRDPAPTLVLWWVPAGTAPSLDEAVERLARLRADGPSPEAFDFRSPADPPGATAT
ncbi:DUF3291 domain-containing protein [Marinitenerispora sediminis]|uniref:DUF3291 domain-containing protein n=1 Tax=Marinitenerispora sediminis TaxID=1931232 RepID=A0A368T876_9ACTN|nr:DUF3291 domain-containing protein [Marinitenerispora sediminis]RCV57307.1 DUF3291 domain-containing protein [Marinitenerispora sediminis]RCV58280.1 DUF3291 domain-containing protein [Marinitenerispora sediminis]RCV58503.1 DUF3291 domain-containing protein [Marinitenerispora sediminis]